jgi:hypothetical protein
MIKTRKTQAFNLILKNKTNFHLHDKQDGDCKNPGGKPEEQLKPATALQRTKSGCVLLVQTDWEPEPDHACSRIEVSVHCTRQQDRPARDES